MRKFLCLVTLSCLVSFQVQAHKVVASAWTDGADIEGEAGFSNGDMALTGTLVEIFKNHSEKIGETKILDDGLFRYTPSEATTYRFFINLGAGHVAEVIVNPDELPENLQQSTTPVGVGAVTPSTSKIAISSDIATLVAKAVRKEIQPLRKEIASYKEKNNLQSILGGIGYIFGLTGIVFYIAARRKESQKG